MNTWFLPKRPDFHSSGTAPHEIHFQTLPAEESFMLNGILSSGELVPANEALRFVLPPPVLGLLDDMIFPFGVETGEAVNNWLSNLKLNRFVQIVTFKPQTMFLCL